MKYSEIKIIRVETSALFYIKVNSLCSTLGKLLVEKGKYPQKVFFFVVVVVLIIGIGSEIFQYPVMSQAPLLKHCAQHNWIYWRVKKQSES